MEKIYTPEWSRYYHLDGLNATSALHGRFVTHLDNTYEGARFDSDYPSQFASLNLPYIAMLGYFFQKMNGASAFTLWQYCRYSSPNLCTINLSSA
jgi:hypothetical protein